LENAFDDAPDSAPRTVNGHLLVVNGICKFISSGDVIMFSFRFVMIQSGPATTI
jgi:hypothetical protein